jgi:hypothetical protein
MKHTKQVVNFAGSHEQLATEIGDLYYDSLADLLRKLSDKIETDAQADHGRGRPRLAGELAACAGKLAQSATHIDTAWDICEPQVKSWREGDV